MFTIDSSSDSSSDSDSDSGGGLSLAVKSFGDTIQRLHVTRRPGMEAMSLLDSADGSSSSAGAGGGGGAAKGASAGGGMWKTLSGLWGGIWLRPWGRECCQ